ncbi:hypothetical protein F3I62_18835 [Pseudomonas sp. R-28-1W-6]|uniref:hypothetical protein n=1 Tax=Pseudomonas sp. R-28-1W-6 TaxID=2650101 RepID=UPI00136574C3|nr:hypothetical protein [Pseudomonas sp. R-28-1W-6]MWV14161.1 hypothetical protein [Pseudomonas sp. R-28-1W-6]
MKTNLKFEQSRVEKISDQLFGLVSLRVFRDGILSPVVNTLYLLSKNTMTSLLLMYFVGAIYLHDGSSFVFKGLLDDTLDIVREVSKMNFGALLVIPETMLKIHGAAIIELAKLNLNPIILIVATYPFVLAVYILKLIAGAMASKAASGG